jgi:glycosidase
MLYAGQEYGERGMDREGFSGNDGRTTIFDYWTIDTLYRASNKQLTDDEKSLYHIYKKTMQIARREKAISEGVFFDLMYVNQHLHRQYVFLRRAGSDLLLIAANFDGDEAVISVNIPAHAFDYLQLKERKGVVSDLLEYKTKMTISIKPDNAVRMSIPAYGARVWKMKA